MMSGSGSGPAAGAADFLGKPFALTELLARVRARLGPASPGAAAEVIR
jgi:DNA-binding response OmpR family regulator